MFAIDGCKLSSNAAKTWSGTHQELKDKRDKLKCLIQHHLKEHQKQDQRGQWDSEVQKRHQQTIDTLSQAADKIEKFLSQNEPRQGTSRSKNEVKSNITDNESAKMKTAKGTIQGYNGIASVDKKHQIVIEAQASGSGQEQQTLQPILEISDERYHRLDIQPNVYKTDIVAIVDTGFANEANMQSLYEKEVNAYIPDNHFRSRDPKFASQKTKYPRASRANPNAKQVIPATEFHFDPMNNTGECPAGKQLHREKTQLSRAGNVKQFFRRRKHHCHDCELKTHCMRNPAATVTCQLLCPVWRQL